MTVYYANVYYYYTDKIRYAYSHPLHIVSGKDSQYTSDSEECDMGNSVSNCDRKRRGFLKSKGISRVFKDKKKKCPGNENDASCNGAVPVFCDSACDYVNFKIGRSYSDFLYDNKSNVPLTNYDNHVYENTNFLFGFQQSIPEISCPVSSSDIGDSSNDDESECTENYSGAVQSRESSSESDDAPCANTERCECYPVPVATGVNEIDSKQGAESIYYKQTSPDLLNAINDLDKQLDQEEIYNRIENVFSADVLPKDLLSSSFLSGSLYFSINEFHNTPYALDEPYENIFFSCAGSQLDVRYEYDSDSNASTATLGSNTEFSSQIESDVEQDYQYYNRSSLCDKENDSEDDFYLEQYNGLLSRSSSSSIEFFSVYDPTERENTQALLNWKKPPQIPKLLVHRSRSESAGRRRPLRPISLNDESTSQESLYDSPVRNISYFCEKAPPVSWKAEEKKNEGNEYYKTKNYRAALESYKDAISLCPTCASYYSNRSACYMMLGKYSEALADARECLKLDPEFIKGYVRVGKCNIALGDANAAISILTRAAELQPSKAISDEMNNAQSLNKYLEEINKSITKRDFRAAVFHIDRALEYAVACRSLKINKAENLLLLQRFSEAEELVNEILLQDNHNADAIYVRGLCLYYQDNQAAAITHLQHVLRLAPDHKKARDSYKKAKQLKEKKDAGNEAFNGGKLSEALKLYSEALTIDPTNKTTSSKLYFNRATVKSKLRQFEEAVDDCTQAIRLNEKYVKAYIRRIKCYQSLEKFEEAVRDSETLYAMDRSNTEYKHMLNDAKLQLKKSKRKDYYKILGLSKGASEDEIKKAYKKKALLHHPDRHSSATDKEKREHEIMFKEIGEAYTILTDPKKRAMYENGQDINDSYGFDGGFDPNELFREFFAHGNSSNPFQSFGFGSGQGHPFYSF